MQSDDWVPFFAEAVRRGRRSATGADDARVSDRALVQQAYRDALEHGEPGSRAWSAAVGAYLERYPATRVFTAERIVSCLMRPDIPAVEEPPPPAASAGE